MQNIEIKARYAKPGSLHKKLMELGADFKGNDHQIDTYFKVPEGRLKLREGTIENALIAYKRPNQEEAKRSDFELYHSTNLKSLKKLLIKSLGILVVVDKNRRIYYIDHVKFHIDEVKGLGNFMEIEVTDLEERRNIKDMKETCQHYMELLNIKTSELIDRSYSDLLLDKSRSLGE